MTLFNVYHLEVKTVCQKEKNIVMIEQEQTEITARTKNETVALVKDMAAEFDFWNMFMWEKND